MERLEPDEIDVLADKAEYCSDVCQFYHGRVRFLKELENLIAPVDAELFGESLLERYQKWKENVQERGRRFRVLIPAQADGTTIGGIFDYLDDQGISQEEVIEKFSFELADLCVTSLLRVYAELKRRRLLKAMDDNIQIRSMDVFRWPQEEAKFDFICTDHFIDLFSPKGEFSQKNLLLSLVKSLAPDGQIVLTTRCGSLEKPLEVQDILNGFYEKVDKHIERLLEQLRESREVSLVHELIALLLYRQLREVYPFKTEEDLAELLDQVSNYSEEIIDCQIERLEEGKVKIVISRKSE